MSRLNGGLGGVRVLDLSRYLPGPLAGMLIGSEHPSAASS